MASVSFNDMIALIRHCVQTSLTKHTSLGDKTLNEVIGGRVFGPSLFDADSVDVELPCIILDLFGGGAEYSSAIQINTIYVYAYDDSGQGVATEIYEAFRTVTQGTRLVDPDGNINGAGYAHEQTRPVVGKNEKMKSWFSRGVWSVRLASL